MPFDGRATQGPTLKERTQELRPDWVCRRVVRGDLVGHMIVDGKGRFIIGPTYGSANTLWGEALAIAEYEDAQEYLDEIDDCPSV